MKKEKKYKESEKFTIFCNYGVIGAEKRNVYTYGAPHAYASCSDKMTVYVPANESFEICESITGELFVSTAWGWDYDINDVLRGDDKPCFRAANKSGDLKKLFLIEA